MKQGFLLAATIILLFGQAYGQFGKLTKALSKAKTFADLRISDEDEQALGQAISQRVRDIYGSPAGRGSNPLCLSRRSGSGGKVQPAQPSLDLHHSRFGQHQRLRRAGRIHPYHSRGSGGHEIGSRTGRRFGPRNDPRD